MKTRLLICTLALIATLSATQAHAVTTPQQYCTSLGTSYCEILNVEVGGMMSNTNLGGIIKYCKGGLFKIALWYSGNNNGTIYSTVTGGIIGTPVTNDSCVNLP